MWWLDIPWNKLSDTTRAAMLATKGIWLRAGYHVAHGHACWFQCDPPSSQQSDRVYRILPLEHKA